jgi:hypothetical protein
MYNVLCIIGDVEKNGRRGDKKKLCSFAVSKSLYKILPGIVY